MRIALISPTYPPDRCGVGDHSARLLQALEHLGHKVVRFNQVPRDESRLIGVDAIVLQYTPYLWSSNKLKLAPALPMRLKFNRRNGIPVLVIAHEIHYPISGSLKGIILGVGQRLQFLSLTRVSDWVFFTYEAARRPLIHKASLGLKSNVLPVGSNIPRSALPFEKTGFDRARSVRLLHFGGDHPTHLLNWTVMALDAVRRSPAAPNASLVWVGLSEADKIRILTQMSRHDLAPHIEALGYLPETEVSSCLAQATLVVAPFMDGISTRRGSVMAAFEHGVPVVTTRGWASDPAIEWNRFCRLSSMQGSPVPVQADAAEFCREVVRALDDPDGLAGVGHAGMQAYSKLFSWEHISSELLNTINEIRSR